MSRIGIVAGEASGDLLGSLLIQAVRSRDTSAEFAGIAGPRMMAQGATSWYPMEKLAVRGYLEVLRHLPELLSMRRELAQRLIAAKPDVVIGIDSPDFNLGLERTLKARGIPTVHYVSPSLWAWRPERVHKIGASVDRVLALFPFEPPIYERAGVPVTYVGHPFADFAATLPARAQIRAQLKVATDALVIALLPGSRQSELDFHAELFIETAKRLYARFPDARFLVPLASRETRAQFDRALFDHGAQSLPVQPLFGHSHLALVAADVALLASGTATLEAMLVGCPHVISYRVSSLTYRLYRRKAILPYVGLPNILAGEFIVPELLQHDATPDNLAQAVGNLIAHRDIRARLKTRFAELGAQLRVDNARRVADALEPYLKRVPQSQPQDDSSQHASYAYLRR